MFRASPEFLAKLEARSPSASKLPPDHRAFLDAAGAGDAEEVRELLAKGVPVDVREDFSVHYSQSEQTALMYAAGEGHLEVVRVLLKAGASVQAMDKMLSRDAGGEHTALHYGARQPNVAVVEELLNAGADPNALTKNATNRGYTPLNYALRKGHRDIAQLLISRTNLGSKIGRKQAMSPLCALINESDDDVPNETIRDLFLMLLEAGADPNGVGDANQTVVFALAGVDASNAKELSFEIANELLEKLLKAGANPDWLDKFGSSPLQNALMRHNPGAVRLLLEAGADVNRIFRRGTALDISEDDVASCEKSLRELPKSRPSADEKGAAREKQLRAVLEDRLRRCNEIREILGKFGGKKKAGLQ